MNLTADEKPKNVSMLNKRRRGIIRRLKKQARESDNEKLLDRDYVQRINDAYEFLKADLQDTIESIYCP